MQEHRLSSEASDCCGSVGVLHGSVLAAQSLLATGVTASTCPAAVIAPLGAFGFAAGSTGAPLLWAMLARFGSERKQTDAGSRSVCFTPQGSRSSRR